MGLFDRVNRFWSGLDFWDKEENRRQRDEAVLRNTRSQQALQLSQQRETNQRNRNNNQRGRGTRTNNYVERREPIAPAQSNLNKLRDVIDANTEADQYRRLREGRPADFKADLELNRRNNIQSTATNPFRRIGEEITEAPRRLAIGIFGAENRRQAQEGLQREQQYLQENIAKGFRKLRDPNVSLEEKQRWHNYLLKEYANTGQRDAEIRRELERYVRDVDPVAGAAAVAELGLDIATLGAGGAVFKGTKQAFKSGAKEGLRFVGKNAFKPIAAGAAAGGTGVVTAQGSDATPGSVALGAAAGAGLATLFPALGAAFSKLGSKTNPDAVISKVARTATKEEVKEIAEKEIGISISDEAAEVIAKTEDDTLIKSVLDAEAKISDPDLPVVSVKRADGTLEQYKPKDAEELARYQKAIDDNRLANGDDTNGIAGLRDANGDTWHISSGSRVKNNYNVIEDAPEIPGLQSLTDQQKVELDQIAKQAGFKNHEELLNADKPRGASDITETAGVSPEQAPLDNVPATKIETPEAPEPKKPDTLLEEVVNRSEEAKARYPKKTIKDKLATTWDKRTEAVKLDRAFAKMQKKKIGEIDATESLDALLEASEQSKGIAAEYMLRSPAAGVIQKTGADTAESTAFNTYRLFMRDLEQRADGRPPLFRDVSNEELVGFIQDFEAKNPTAREDLLKIVETVEGAQDVAARNGVVPQEELVAARTKKDGSKYQFWTPAERALPEETERAAINAANIGTIGRQKVLQDFTGSDIPLNPTYDAVTDYIETAFRQVGQAKVSQKFFERVEQGLVPGAKIIQTGDEFARLKKVKATYGELRDLSKSLKIKKAITGRKAGFAKKEAGQATAKMTTRARSLLRDMVADEDAAAVIPNLSREELSDILKYASQDELFSKGAKNTKRIYNNFVNKSEAHRRLVERVEDIKMDIASLESAKDGVRSEIAMLRQDPTTGLQTILGRDANGNPFKIEVPPRYAELLQGLNSGSDNPLIKGAAIAQKPFREAFTGILNPSFQLAQATYNAVMAPIVTDTKLWNFYSPDAIVAAIKSFSGSDEFSRALTKHGAIKYGGGLQKLPGDSSAKALAAQADLFTKGKWLLNPRRAYEKISSLGGKLDQAARTQAARARFNEGIMEGLSKEKALANAVYEYNNVLPNFSNLSTFVKSVDSVLPYTGAGQAGTRTILRAIRNRPGRTGGRLAAASLGLTGVVAYNMANEAGAAFYQDMKESGRDWVIDNNIIIVLPGASKNEETGEWSGVIKMPLAPELRPVNKAINETFLGQGVPVKQYAMSMFDFLTGQARQNSSPVAEIATGIQTGTDPRTGRPIYDETMNDEDKRKAIKNFVAYKFGVAGRQFADGNERGFIDSMVDRMYGAKGSTSGSRYFQIEDEAIKEVGLNGNELDAFRSTVTPRSKDLVGNSIKDKTYYDSASKATTWLRYPKTFEASRLIDMKKREAGEPGDPLFDLPEDRRKLVLSMMSNYSPGNFEDKAIAELNPWLEDFNKQRSAYFEEVIKSPSDLDPMGLKIPKANEALQKKLDTAKGLSGADKAKYLSDNDDVTDFYSQLNAYQRSKREFLGLPQFDNYPQVSDELQASMDAYFSLDKSGRKSWREAHPKTWQAMVEQWQKQDIYTLQQEGALAVYEGIDFTEKGIKSIEDLAQALGYSGGGGSGGGSRGSRNRYTIGSSEISNMLGASAGKQLRSLKPKQVVKKQKSAYIPGTNTPRKLNIKSLALPNSLPTFDSTKGKG